MTVWVNKFLGMQLLSVVIALKWPSTANSRVQGLEFFRPYLGIVKVWQRWHSWGINGKSGVQAGVQISFLK